MYVNKYTADIKNDSSYSFEKSLISFVKPKHKNNHVNYWSSNVNFTQVQKILSH